MRASFNPFLLFRTLLLTLSADFNSTVGVTYYVDASSGKDTNSGKTWSAAKASIKAAVDLAKTNDVVLVNEGVYQLSDTLEITNSITVRSLMGAHYTVIDGDFPAREITCIRVKNEFAVLDGFTIRNGSRGVLLDGEASGTIRNCVVNGIAGNGVVFQGGGRAESCTIAYNRDAGLYAADMGDGGDPTVNLILYGNGTNWLLKSANILCDTCMMENPGLAGTNDFRLVSNSPCLDAGKTRNWMTNSIAAQGNRRIANSIPDIGAYELASLKPVRNSANGHYYDFVEAQAGWPQARQFALSLSFNGWNGHLVTITSQAEQSFLETNFPGRSGFIGASDAQTEGDWKWADGPEGNQLFFRGRYPSGQTNGFSNWGSNEPNDFDNRPGGIVAYSGEDYLAFHDPIQGKWNDIAGSPFTLPGFFVEFSAPLPSLKAAVVGTNLVLSWSSNSIGFTLEDSGVVENTVWEQTNLNIATNAENYSVSAPLTGSRRFYRLTRR